MKKIITISTIFASSAIFAFASTPACPDSPITAIVASSQKGGADSAKKIMQIQAKENIDVSKDSFLIYLLASCEGADSALLSAAKEGNSYAIKALKMKRLADAEDCLLGLTKSSNVQARKDAIDALSACGSEKTLDFIINDMATTDASNLVDYVRVSTELYKALEDSKKADYKAKIQAKADSSDGKIKVALERIIVEPKAADEASADGEDNSRRSKRKRG